ncbi:HAMP domain-containing histidine kinase [Paramuribaculum intestinale]|uniref:sensor histidine kinase n=1 Tax=Paramuribaculum intestinale TaxID=2094151 RepID=UPI000D1EF135|nr:HAMP domain-containing sensor histidine kinase [Paramuribaculum intestinale]PWB07685.1 sensor histidine kinase [Paramuribaculum intestinale]ROS90955.1 sensor histidine kinase [Muribaculaceae bacterium Isolate-043 (Harlan)]WLT42803.1 HAMP domain-containing histidine kinase [Paramuribaculum intestinale]
MGLLNKFSYPQRLFVWLLGYSLLMVGCFVVFQYHREKEFKAEEIDKQLQLINTYILTELGEGHDVPDIRLDDFKPFDDIRVSVISEDGHIIYDNTLDSLPKTNHLDRQEIRDALRLGSGYAVRRHSESTGNNYFYSAKKSDDGNIVRTAVPYSVSFRGLLQADYGFLWIMGIITMVMCVLGYFATRRVGLHIIRLNRFAENVENGAQISDTEPFPHDELGEISNHIVRLYARLQQAVADRDSEHRAALHEQLEKERIKKQLTNNINHELKTPVASIRVSVETMLAHRNMSDEKQILFLQRCLTNTERLQRLLTDVSLLTRMDDGSASILKEQVNLTDIINDVVEDRQIIAATKGIRIENFVSHNVIMAGNASLLEAVFNNLIDNAIVYCGGTRIKIELISIDNDKVVIALSDNGCGVPPEHLPRLFERFYRIDKGRSRAAGGTGLGLSIVKNAVILHGGEISAETQCSGGLLFKIIFSRNSK